MSMSESKDFTQMSEELSHRLQAVAYEYFGIHGLPTLPVTSMTQMSVSLIDLSRELLMFGADKWPDSAIEADPVVRLVAA